MCRGKWTGGRIFGQDIFIYEKGVMPGFLFGIPIENNTAKEKVDRGLHQFHDKLFCNYVRCKIKCLAILSYSEAFGADVVQKESLCDQLQYSFSPCAGGRIGS